MLTREGDALLSYLPHRFENVLIDSVVIKSDELGSLFIHISEKDSQGRHLFLKQKNEFQSVLVSPVLMEILALGSIVSRNVVVSNETVVFASISNFEKLSDFNASTNVRGSVTLTSNKGGFLKYKGLLESNSLICKGDMLAFFTSGSLNQDIPEDASPISYATSTPIEKPSFKSEWMHCADALCEISETSITTQYTYPENHPLIRGHFPGNPLMMGVMQWMSVEDALLVFCQKNNLDGHRKFTCDATLIKDNGVVVSEIKSITLSSWVNCEGMFNQTDIIATKKIAFRTTVRPGETIFIRVENIQPA